MADPARYNPFPGLPPAAMPVQQPPWGAPRSFDTDQQQQQQQQRIPLQTPNYNQVRQHTFGPLFDPLGPVEYKNIYDETNMPDPITRFEDLEELDGINDQRIHEYHNHDACGPDARAEGDLTSTFEESLVRNGIFCRFTHYGQFSEFNKATRAELTKLIQSRQRACRCAVKRRFAMAHYKKKGEPTVNHEAPLKIAEKTCEVCGQIQRELMRWGYLKHTSLVAEKHEALKQLTLAVHELLTDGRTRISGRATRARLILTRSVSTYGTRSSSITPSLQNLRKSMPFEDFKELMKSIDAIAKADKHKFERKKAQTVKPRSSRISIISSATTGSC